MESPLKNKQTKQNKHRNYEHESLPIIFPEMKDTYGHSMLFSLASNQGPLEGLYIGDKGWYGTNWGCLCWWHWICRRQRKTWGPGWPSSVRWPLLSPTQTYCVLTCLTSHWLPWRVAEQRHILNHPPFNKAAHNCWNKNSLMKKITKSTCSFEFSFAE